MIRIQSSSSFQKDNINASLNVTCVIQEATLVTRAGIYMPVWMAIKARHLQYASTMTTTTRVLSLRTSLVLKKCMNKFDCLVNEMLYIKQLTPNLNVQADSIRAKVFVKPPALCKSEWVVTLDLAFLNFISICNLDNGGIKSPKRREIISLVFTWLRKLNCCKPFYPIYPGYLFQYFSQFQYFWLLLQRYFRLFTAIS